MHRICLASILLFTLTLAACAAPVAPATHAPKEVIEYRQLINSDPQRLAKLASTFFAVQAESDDQSQTLILKGLPDQVAMAVEMTNRLEIAHPDDVQLQHFFIKHLHNAKAKDVAAILDALDQKGAFPNSTFALAGTPAPVLIVVPDERTNAVLVNTDRAYEERIRGILDELDRSDTPATQPEIRIENHSLTPRQPTP